MQFLIESTNAYHLMSVKVDDVLVFAMTAWDAACIGSIYWTLKVYNET